jgi:hypothetical protein
VRLKRKRVASGAERHDRAGHRQREGGPPLRDENPNVGSHGRPLGLALLAGGLDSASTRDSVRRIAIFPRRGDNSQDSLAWFRASSRAAQTVAWDKR